MYVRVCSFLGLIGHAHRKTPLYLVCICSFAAETHKNRFKLPLQLPWWKREQVSSRIDES